MSLTGLATSLGLYAQLGYLLLHFRNKDRMLHLTKLETSWAEMAEILSLGTEKASRRIASVIAPIALDQMIISFGGSLAMSAMAVQNNVYHAVAFMAVGLADATALQAGIFYGEKNAEAIRETGNCVHRYIGRSALIVGLIVLVFAGPITSLYIAERGELFDMAVFGVRMTALIFLSSLLYIVLSAFLLGKAFGAYGVLATDLFAALLTLLTTWMYYAAKSRRPLPSVNDYLTLPDSFELCPGDVISLDIRDEEDISLVAEQIQIFCKGHKADSRTGLKAAVCFEELAINIIRFGFPKCKGQPGIDLRLVYTKDEIIMRLRDNCPMFDVERYIAKKMAASKDAAETGLGLRIIGGLAEDIRYFHSLDNNNVIIRFPNH